MTGPFDQVDPSSYHVSRSSERLPDVLPAEPWGTFVRWYDEAHARKVQANPNAMTLATVDGEGWPSARVVLCKAMHDWRDGSAGRECVVFYTNYLGRKGRAIDAAGVGGGKAAVCFHWDALDRQVRIEGPCVRSPASESDAYYRSRPWESRLGAWASDQSAPIESRAAMHAKVKAMMARFGIPEGAASDFKVEIPRPAHWGGYRVYARRVELWVAGTGRVHDRAVWERELSREGDGFVGGAWRAWRVQP